MATKSSASWLVLAAALAVPGFLFYQWWSHLNTQARAELQQRVRRRLPPGQMFGHAPAKEKLSNPMLAASSGEVALSTAAAPAAPETAEAGAQPAAAPAPEAAAAPPEAPAKPEAILRTGPIEQIVLARDPLLSPFDVVRIAEAEARARRAQEELEAAARAKKPGAKRKAPRAPDPSSLVELQGIVSTESGDKAIVNGEVVGEGDSVGEIRVVKISASAVVFLYKNKRFTKGISK